MKEEETLYLQKESKNKNSLDSAAHKSIVKVFANH